MKLLVLVLDSASNVVLLSAGQVSSWRECARRCASLGSCQLWTWHTGSRHCAAMDSAGTKTFDASSMAGRWDCTALYCTVLYCTVLYCRWDCDYYGKTDPGGD